jgi:hypothetical protein
MARRIFFSFHYERDVWRAGQVRNCNLLPSEDQLGFIDSVEWESIRRQGNDAIKEWIDDQLQRTSVTVVLIGAETAFRPWVQHEILRSWNRGNGVVGVRIHNIKDQEKATDMLGPDPFYQFTLPDGTRLSNVCKIYDWVAEDGRNNLGQWCERAAEIRGEFGSNDKIDFAGESSKRSVAPSPVPRIAVSAPSAAFTPRAPWCIGDADTGR